MWMELVIEGLTLTFIPGAGCALFPREGYTVTRPWSWLVI